LFFRRRRTDIQHVHLNLRRRGLLGASRLRQPDADKDYQDVSEHEGILNEDREKS